MRHHHFLSACVGVLSKARSGLVRVVEVCAFWTATLLPLGYVPLLLAIPSRFVSLTVFGQLLTVNIVALVLGRGYGAEAADTDDGD